MSGLERRPDGQPPAAKAAAAPPEEARDVLGTLRRTVTMSRGLPGHFAPFGAGAASVLALAPFHLAPVLFFTLPVLVWRIDGGGVRHAALSGWWFGFGYFLAGLFWIGEAFLVEADKFAWALPFAVTLLPAGLALFTAAAAAAARLLWPRGLGRVLTLAVTLAASEWLRGHVFTGFPWNVLGYALTWPLVLMQGASLVGIYGLTLWTVAIGAAPLTAAADAPLRRRRRGWAAGLALAAVPLAGLLAYGAVRLSSGPAGTVPGPRLRIVQPAVAQTDKWRPEKQTEIFAAHLALSRRNPAGHDDGLSGITHVVWAEAAMPFMPLDHPEALAAIGGLLPPGVMLLAGGLRIERDGHFATPRAFNSLMIFDDKGELARLYDKIHLVPFGEYLPFQETLESLGFEQLTRQRGGFAPGRTPRPILDVPGLPPLAGLICYEAIFPGVLGDGAAGDSERPKLLINITNDGWFGHTAGPYQHFHQARVRAVEEGLPLIRAANNGISASIDSRGRIVARLDLDQRGVIDTLIPLSDIPPPFARLRTQAFVLSIAIFVTMVVAFGRRFDENR